MLREQEALNKCIFLMSLFKCSSSKTLKGKRKTKVLQHFAKSWVQLTCAADIIVDTM